MKKKKINEYPYLIGVVAIPFLYLMMVVKILQTIPITVIALCNGLIEKVEGKTIEK